MLDGRSGLRCQLCPLSVHDVFRHIPDAYRAEGADPDMERDKRGLDTALAHSIEQGLRQVQPSRRQSS